MPPPDDRHSSIYNLGFPQSKLLFKNTHSFVRQFSSFNTQHFSTYHSRYIAEIIFVLSK